MSDIIQAMAVIFAIVVVVSAIGDPRVMKECQPKNQLKRGDEDGD